jgi:integrase
VKRGIYENHLIPSFGSIPLNRITVDQVEAYQARRKNEKRAASTINKEVQLLKNIANKATEWGKLLGYQFGSVKPFKEPEGRVRFIDEEEKFDKLITALPTWLRPIAIISAFTGVRQGEVRTLRQRNIDKNRRQITLEKTKN